MDSPTPFYQQLSVRFGALFVLFLCALAFVFSLFYLQSQQFTQVLQQDIPQIKQAQQQSNLLNGSQQLVLKIQQAKTSGELYQAYLGLLNQLTELEKNTQTNNKALTQVISLLQVQQNNIKRLADNEKRNAQLRNNVLIQLQLVLDELLIVQTDLQEKHDKLYQQIVQDKVSDKVTIARSKAYANLSQQLNKISLTLSAVQHVYRVFSRLSLHYSLADFDHYNQTLIDALSLWQTQFSTIEQATETQKKSLTLLLALQNLLYTEYSAMAKWRGHIRLAQEFIALLAQVSSVLEQQSATLAKVSSSPMGLNDVVNRLLPQTLSVSAQQMMLGIYGTLIILVLSFIIALLKLRARIQGYDESNVKLVEQVLVDDTAVLVAESLFQQQVLQLLTQVTKPEHSEQEFKQLELTVQQQQQRLFDYAGITLFSSQADKPDQYLQSLLFGEVKEQRHWRFAFDRKQVKKLLALAKQAKAENKRLVQQVEVLSGQAIFFVAEYKQGVWHGVVMANDQQAQLTRKCQRLEQLRLENIQDNQLQLANYAEQLQQMLTRASIQNQSASVGGGDSSVQVARQLERMFDWCLQLRVNQTVINQEKPTATTAVFILEELSAWACNISQWAYWQRNKVIFQFEPSLMEQGQINVRMFHHLLNGIAKCCLQDKFNAVLLVLLTVVDKNAGQQIVRVSFEVSADKNANILPESLKNLVNLAPDERKISLLLQYFQVLIQANHASNLQASESEDKCLFSFDMPITLCQSQTKNCGLNVDFKEAAFVCFGEELALVNRVTTAIKASNGTVEHIETIGHFIKLLTTKHLTSHPVDVVIVTPEHFLAHYPEIQQHLKSLAKPIRPKLMILQPHYSNKLHKQGLYQHSELSVQAAQFCQYLLELSHSKQDDNLLVQPEVFKQYQLSQTQVEVLIATPHPHQEVLLARILHGLGLQVHFVCNETMLLRQWQSGRYLVLFNGLTSSPFVDLAVGQNVSRGVFHLSANNNQALKSLEEYHHWHTGTVKNALDITHLVNLLTPWLKETYREPVALAMEQAADNNQALTMKTDKIPQSNKPKASEQDSVQNDDQVFDLFAYAHNQGSPELAVFMLDDYIQEINQAIISLERHLETEDFSQALMDNEQLGKIGRILTAKEISALSQRLSLALTAQSLPQAQEILTSLQLANEQLHSFAQAI